MTACASKIAQVRGNCFAQVRVATTRRMPQQMSALLCEDTGSEPFPNINREFIDCWEAGNQRNARPSAQGSEIKLRPCTLVWNSSYPGRETSSTFDQPICFRFATADSFRGEFVGGKKSLMQRIRHKRPRSGLRAQITFCLKL